MTSGGRPPVSAAARTKVQAALTLFDESLDQLSRHLPAQTQGQGVTATPLPGLLAQCQQHLDAARLRKGPRLLIVLPGLPHLDVDWWRGRTTGLEVFRIAWDAPSQPNLYQNNHTARSRVLRTVVRELHSDCTLAGRDLLLLASPDEALALALDTEDKALLVCHPWLAFGDGLATSQPLEDVCKATLAVIRNHADLPILRLETAGRKDAHAPSDPPLCDGGQMVLDALGLASCWSPTVDADVRAPSFAGEPDSFLTELNPTYAELCTRLGYTADPGPCPPVAVSDLGNAGLSVARVSTFVKRIESLPILGFGDDRAQIHPLVQMLDAVLSGGSGAFIDRFDALTRSQPWRNCVLLQLMAAAHFATSQDVMQALGFVGEALERIPAHAVERPALLLLAASLYLDLNLPRVAMETTLSDLARPDMLSPTGRRAMEAILGVNGAEKPDDHGQALLLHHLSTHPPVHTTRKRLLIEIGTTRETVPGQGSTRQLARLCAREGFDFVTVDMDPRNSRNAARMFRQIGVPFQAVTSKGEDWLARHPGPIDYVFLDAYDFDHGKHSEIRQERYERYLGTRIDDAACHQMHLDCAMALVERLSPDGLICFDDTWMDATGRWTAKGTTAMPFLLQNGFKVLEARNRAALLCRVR